MELTSEKSSEARVEPSGRRSFLLALFGVSGATVGALLAIPLIRFVTYPLRKNATDAGWSDLGPVGDFASLTHYVPDGGLRVAAGERTVPDTVAHMSASRLFCPLAGR
jgi:hypothetical protein